MCGRYTETKAAQVLKEGFRDCFTDACEDEKLPPRYNISPGQEAPVILNTDGTRPLQRARWGLVPFWAKDEKTAYKMINARAESLREKPAYRKLFEKRRCLVLADGFYEWKKGGTVKIPHRFVLGQGELFAFAGLWDRWKKPDDSELHTFTIVTSEPNELVRSCHDRMPVILPRKHYAQWLDPSVTDTDRLHSLLRPYPAGEMNGYPVSPLVNNPRNDTPDCIAAV